jgi:transposase
MNRAIDVSGLVWAGRTTTCPSCGRATPVLLVLAGGRLTCPRCARRP